MVPEENARLGKRRRTSSISLPGKTIADPISTNQANANQAESTPMEMTADHNNQVFAELKHSEHTSGELKVSVIWGFMGIPLHGPVINMVLVG